MFKKIVSIILLIAFSGCVTTEKISFREFSDELPERVEKVILQKDTIVANSNVYIITDTSLVIYRGGKFPLTINKNKINGVVINKIDKTSTTLLAGILLLSVIIIIGTIETFRGGFINTNFNFN